MAKKIAPVTSGDLICSARKPECEKLGKLCAGEKRGSCSGFVCSTHAVIGTEKPFLNKTICRICATRQFGTLTSEIGRTAS